jgi:hypothetical protein
LRPRNGLMRCQSNGIAQGETCLATREKPHCLAAVVPLAFETYRRAFNAELTLREQSGCSHPDGISDRPSMVVTRRVATTLLGNPTGDTTSVIRLFCAKLSSAAWSAILLRRRRSLLGGSPDSANPAVSGLIPRPFHGTSSLLNQPQLHDRTSVVLGRVLKTNGQFFLGTAERRNLAPILLSCLAQEHAPESTGGAS